MLRRGVFTGLFLLSWGAVAVQGQEAATFGSDGTLFRVRAGSYGALFPKGEAADPKTAVLSLEVTREEGVAEQWLVPGTEGEEVDRHAVVVFDRASKRLFLLWESKIDPTLSKLNLVGFSDDAWSEVIEISGDPLPLKGTPGIALTRDKYELLDGLTEPVIRTLFHVVWWEESDGTGRVFYAPLAFLNGEYLGWNPVVLLNRFDPNPSADELASPDLFRAPIIDAGRDGHSVVVGLANPQTGRLLTLEIRVLPALLSLLANHVGQNVLALGSEDPDGSIQNLAEGIRGVISGFGRRLHHGVRGYLAEQAYLDIQLYGATFSAKDLPDIAKGVRALVIDEGASLLGREFHGFSLEGNCNLIHLGAEATSPEAESFHQLEVCIASDRPVPDVGEGPTTLIVSEGGEDVVVAWEEEEKLRYRHSSEKGWSDVRTANRDPEVDLDRAKAILRQLVRIH